MAATAGHQSVSNEEGLENESGRRKPRDKPSLITRPELVPGYTRRPQAVVAPLGFGVISPESGAVGAAVRGAAVASFGGQDQPEIVLGDDDRVPVPDTTQQPWRHICALRINAQTGAEFVGTGWFIGRRTLVTAGHCVYLHEHGGWARSIEVIPALNGAQRSYGQAISKRFRSTDAFVNSRDTNFDYAAILLDEPLGVPAGWFSFAVLPDSEIVTSQASISGYPLDRDRASRQYYHSRVITQVGAQRMFYDIDTFGGQSGSPIWLSTATERIAIGVHTSGSTRANSGTRINEDVFENLRKWLQEDQPAQAAVVADDKRLKKRENVYAGE